VYFEVATDAARLFKIHLCWTRGLAGMPVYREQYDRVKRWYARFDAIDKGRPHDVSSDNYVDEIYAFFLNCYHLKDWIKHDGAVPAAVQQALEGYVSSNRSLCLCADICNSLKHLRLTRREKSGESPTFGAKRFALSLGSEQPTISLKYEVDTAKGPEDAFHLATECMTAWDGFLATNGL
jgi:hypothetical protein